MEEHRVAAPLPECRGDEASHQHRAMLRDVFNFKRLQNQVVEPGVTATQVRKCMELIERGVPVALNGPMPCFLEVDGWYGNELVRELFAAYVHAGYMELNKVSTGFALPLEAAISHNHLDFIKAAMECGADERLVPTAVNRFRYQGCWEEDDDDDDKACEVHDIYDLISHDVTRPQIRAEMEAVLREAAMNRRIRESSPGFSGAAPGASADGFVDSSPRRLRTSL